ARPPDVMLVLGDIGQMREIPERSDDADRLLGRQAADGALQLLARGRLGVATEAKRGLPDVFDELEGALAFLRAHRVTEDAPEVANVVAQRNVPVGLLAKVYGIHRQDRAPFGLDQDALPGRVDKPCAVRCTRMRSPLGFGAHAARRMHPYSRCQTAQSSSFPPRVVAPGFAFTFALTRTRGGRSADRRTMSLV